ncbi:hypothetical protein OUZ56_017160 [Daphnia magna]|uniref:Reverse transcriptase domain-containing protein n=1 Tax=Daphnia magna TaxID=35525 RepID=A0ABR0AS97_9CRUS|nr:hypothetical protein OUZ56_017160 [Daphnia magna]
MVRYNEFVDNPAPRDYGGNYRPTVRGRGRRRNDAERRCDTAAQEEVQRVPPCRVAMSEEMQAVCDAEVANLLDKKAISEITVLFLVREGDWFIKPDLKDAYLTVLVHVAHQKYL